MKYFAYGANTDIEKLQERGVYPTDSCLGWINGYKINFDKIAQGKKMGYANIEQTSYSGYSSEKVYGVIWDITEDELKILDEYEVGYYHVQRVIMTRDRQQVCFLYFAKLKYLDYPRFPGLTYIRRIIKAGEEYGFPDKYMEILRKFEEKAWRPIE